MLGPRWRGPVSAAQRRQRHRRRLAWQHLSWDLRCHPEGDPRWNGELLRRSIQRAAGLRGRTGPERSLQRRHRGHDHRCERQPLRDRRQRHPQDYPGAMVSTLAGNQSISGHADGAGAAASFDSPGGIAVDGSGNVYVAEERNSLVRRHRLRWKRHHLRRQAGSHGIRRMGRWRVPSSLGYGAWPSTQMVLRRGRLQRDPQDHSDWCHDRLPRQPRGGPGHHRLCDRFAGSGRTETCCWSRADNHWLRGVGDAGVMTPVAGSAPLRGLVDGPGIGSRMVEPSAMAVDPQSGAIYLASPTSSASASSTL